jgi:signal transduction histidine kinase
MTEKLTSDILNVLHNMPKGTHLCHFYQTPQDMLDVLVPYFAAGLAKDHKCLWIVDGVLTVEQAQQALAEVVPNWEQVLRSGQIEFYAHTEWYVIDDQFDENRILRQFVAKEAEAVQNGYRGLRITGNTLWARDGMWPDLLEYEQHVDQCFCNLGMTAICTYALDRCSAADVVDVTKAHELILIRREGRWDIIESATRRHMREELRESHERLKTLTQQMVLVEQQERRRISQALHDGLQQTIVGTQLNLARAKNGSGPAQAEALDLVASLLDEALQACRTLTTEISPPILHERGLLPALRWLTSWFGKQHALKVHLQLPGDEPPLGDSERVTLFEVARELLLNVIKHAGASEASVLLQLEAERVRLIVSDPGKGCCSTALETPGAAGKFGLFSARERLRMMDGDVYLESCPRGTRCVAHLPFAVTARTEVRSEGAGNPDSRTMQSGPRQDRASVDGSRSSGSGGQRAMDRLPEALSSPASAGV